jgi:hypothetical protein
MMSSKVFARGATLAARSQSVKKAARTISTSVARVGNKPSFALAGAASGLVAFSLLANHQYNEGKTFCDAGLPVISVGESVKEADTGIM